MAYPSKEVTRAEVAVMISKILGEEEVNNKVTISDIANVPS